MEATGVPVEVFLDTVSERRQREAHELIELMHELSGHAPVMWGPSIIGFDSYAYQNPGGSSGVMPVLAFSPRKAHIVIYFSEGFESYRELLTRLGTHKTGASCLYLTRLELADITVLKEMLKRSLAQHDATGNP